MNTKTKRLLILNAPYLIFALLGTKLGQAARLAPGTDFSGKALHIMDGLGAAFQSAVPSFHPIDLLVGIAFAAVLRLAVYVKGKNAKKFRKNIEYGSARWGTAEDIRPYIDPDFKKNVILTQTERLTMNSRPKDPKTARNKNVLIVGGSGSGKTRFWLKPNLMQMHSSYVITDPKGSILIECGKMLQRGTPKLDDKGKPVRNGKGKIVYEPYRIKVFNTINFKKSMHYNPFSYIHSEKDILKLVTALITNTKGDGKSGDEFWTKAETLLYTALIGYMHYECPVEEQNFAALVEMINSMEVREDDEEFENTVDLLFKELKAALPFSQTSIWHTDAILPLMHDIPNFRLTIVGAERLAAGSVADALENLTDSLILQDSERSLLSRVAPGRELVVVTPQVSQAPVEVSGGVSVPTLEKILVDILCDNALHALTGSEAYAIYAAAFSRYAVSRKTLLRYAGRRNRTEEVNAILKETEK